MDVETRDAGRVRPHYDVERRLARQLRDAPEAACTELYSTLYGELFRTVPDHPQLTRTESRVRRAHDAHGLNG